MEQALTQMITDQRADIKDWEAMIDRTNPNDRGAREFAYAGLRMSRDRLDRLVSGEYFDD